VAVTPRLAEEPATTNRIDLDVEAAVAEAEALIERGDADGAAGQVLDFWSATDRFTVEQRQRLTDRAVAVMERAANTPNPERALMHRDAAWILRGRPADPEYSRALLERTGDASPPHAAYLATRAAVVDPSNAAALELRDSYATDTTNNWLLLTGGLAIGSAITAGIL
jgi:hypothetical protein